MIKTSELFKKTNPVSRIVIKTDNNVIASIENNTSYSIKFTEGEHLLDSTLKKWAEHNQFEIEETTSIKEYCVEFKKPEKARDKMLLEKIRIKLASTQFNIRLEVKQTKQKNIQYRFKSIPEYNTAVKLIESLGAEPLVLREGLTVTTKKQSNTPSASWIYPSLEQNSEILLGIVIQVIKRDAEAFEGFIGSELPTKATETMVNKGISYMEGKCTEDEYISALDKEMKSLSNGKIKLTEFAKEHIRSRMRLFYTPQDKIKMTEAHSRYPDKSWINSPLDKIVKQWVGPNSNLYLANKPEREWDEEDYNLFERLADMVEKEGEIPSYGNKLEESEQSIDRYFSVTKISSSTTGSSIHGTGTRYEEKDLGVMDAEELKKYLKSNSYVFDQEAYNKIIDAPSGSVNTINLYGYYNLKIKAL